MSKNKTASGDNAASQDTREGRKPERVKLFVCTEGKKCPKRGSDEILKALNKEVDRQSAGDVVVVKETGCLKLCKHGPSVMAMPGKTCYGEVEKSDCAELVTAARSGQTVERLEVEGKKKKKKKKKD